MGEKDDGRAERAKKIGEAIAKALGFDARNVRAVRLDESGMAGFADIEMGGMDGEREDRLDALFELHRADALAVVEAAKEEKHKGACCEDCAVRAVAGGQLEGAVLALLRNEGDEHLWEVASNMSGLVFQMLEQVLEERKAERGGADEGQA